jgi:hypothetical protein
MHSCGEGLFTRETRLMTRFQKKPPSDRTQESGAIQGCQIFLGKTYQNWQKITKLLQNIPDYNKIFQMSVVYSLWP